MSYGGFTLPIGFRFQPSDEQLLSHYLENKNQGKDSQITDIIPEIDVCKHEPRDLPALVFTRADFLEREWFTMADSPDMEWYFFSPRVFKHSKSKRQSALINRTTGEGSWKKQGNDYRITGACSNKQIGGKRILTFYLSKKHKTDWVIHEYYLTDADSDQQIGDFVLCRLQNNQLKNNRLKKKSSKSDHDQQKTPGGEPSSGSCSMAPGVEDQASKEQRHVLPIPNGDDDEAAHDGKQLEDILPNFNGIESIDHDAEDGGESCHIASGFRYGAVEYGKRTEAEEYQAYGMLRDAVCESDGNEKELKGLQTDSCYVDKNYLSASLEGQSDGYNSPDSEMVEGQPHEPGTLVLHHRPSSPFLNEECRKRKYPFGDRDPCLTKKNHTDEIGSENEGSDGMSEENGKLLLHPDECCSLALWSPASQELEAVLQTNITNDDCNELQSPVGDSVSCLPDTNELSTRDEDETVYDVYRQEHKNDESSFHQPQHQPQAQALDDCYSTAIWSPTFIGLEAVLQKNCTNDDCIELQSTLGVKDLCFSGNNEFSTYDEDQHHV